MSTPYLPYRPRSRASRLLGGTDDFMRWLLYGDETWLVALVKGVALFLYVYFLLTYVPNYAYYLVTVEIPFLRFSDDVGFLVAAGIGGSFFPARFPLQALGFGALVAGMGAVTLVYLVFEFRRVTRREAEAAAGRS